VINFYCPKKEEISEIRKKVSEDYDTDDHNNKIKHHESNNDVPDPGQEDMSQIDGNYDENDDDQASQVHRTKSGMKQSRRMDDLLENSNKIDEDNDANFNQY